MASLKGKKILVADDEPMLREILRDVLEYEGAKVKEASNGKEALASIIAEPVDAVISDIRMPGGDGLELLEKLRVLDVNTPVVMLITGFSDLSHDAAYEKGADCVLSKPFDVNELLDRLNALLRPIKERFSKTPQTLPQANVLTNSVQRMALGRGGVFIEKQSDLFVGTSVNFDLHLPDLNRSLRGTGVVRWVRKAAQGPLVEGTGIEFSYLDEGSLQAVLAYLNTHAICAFIPDHA